MVVRGVPVKCNPLSRAYAATSEKLLCLIYNLPLETRRELAKTGVSVANLNELW